MLLTHKRQTLDIVGGVHDGGLYDFGGGKMGGPARFGKRGFDAFVVAARRLERFHRLWCVHSDVVAAHVEAFLEAARQGHAARRTPVPRDVAAAELATDVAAAAALGRPEARARLSDETAAAAAAAGVEEKEQKGFVVAAVESRATRELAVAEDVSPSMVEARRVALHTRRAEAKAGPAPEASRVGRLALGPQRRLTLDRIKRSAFGHRKFRFRSSRKFNRVQ